MKNLNLVLFLLIVSMGTVLCHPACDGVEGRSTGVITNVGGNLSPIEKFKEENSDQRMPNVSVGVST